MNKTSDVIPGFTAREGIVSCPIEQGHANVFIRNGKKTGKLYEEGLGQNKGMSHVPWEFQNPKRYVLLLFYCLFLFFK